MKLQVHLFQRLLHPKDLLGGALHQRCTMTPIGAQLQRFGARNEAPLQKAECVQFAQPTAVPHIGLAAGNALGMVSVHQLNVETGIRKHLVSRNPINTRGLHDHRANLTFLEPGGHGSQVGSIAAKRANRLLVPVFGNRNIVRLRTDVDTCHIGVENQEAIENVIAGLLRVRTRYSLLCCRKRLLSGRSNLPIRRSSLLSRRGHQRPPPVELTCRCLSRKEKMA